MGKYYKQKEAEGGSVPETVAETPPQVKVPQSFEEADRLYSRFVRAEASIHSKVKNEFEQIASLQQQIADLEEQVEKKVGKRIKAQKERQRILNEYVLQNQEELLGGMPTGKIKFNAGTIEIVQCPQSLQCEDGDEHKAALRLVHMNLDMFVDAKLKKNMVRDNLVELVDKYKVDFVGMGNNRNIVFYLNIPITDYARKRLKREADKLQWPGEITEQ